MKIISRKEAEKLGLVKYFTRKPCVHGHISERNISKHQCLECRDIDNKNWRNKKRSPYVYNKEKARAYYLKNKKKIVGRSIKYRLENLEKANAISRNKKAKRIGAQGNHTGQEIIFKIKKQKYRCANCECDISEKHHIDHIQPLSKGGRNDIRNLQILCPACNLEKGAKDPIDWAQDNGRLL